MELVGARLGGGIDDGAGGAAELGVVVAGLDLEFLKSIGRRHHDVVGLIEQVGEIGVVVDAVE